MTIGYVWFSWKVVCDVGLICIHLNIFKSMDLQSVVYFCSAGGG